MKPKVLIVTALAGFIRSFLMNDIKTLQLMGYEVHCAANKNHPGAGKIEKYFKDNNIIFHQIDFSSSNPISKETAIAYRQLKNISKNINFKIMHCHTPIAGAVARWVFKSKRKMGTKVLYTTHGFYFHKGSSKKSWVIFRSIEKFMSRFTDKLITINKEDYMNAKKMKCSDILYIPGVGVETKKFIYPVINRNEYRKKLGISNGAFVILAIGELSKRKNHQIIIKALGELNLSNVVFVICGNEMTNSNTSSTLKSLAKENNVDIRLLGLRRDIIEICYSSDIGVMPSTREGLGLAGIEMLASGLPVVASNVHGIVDYIVDGYNGYLCNPFDSHEFAIAINKLINKDLRDSMKLNCVNSTKLFDKEVSVQKMREIYESII